MDNKINWVKKVEESNGASVLLPEVLLEEANNWKKEREELHKLADEAALQISRKEIHVNILFQNLTLKIRQYLEKNGKEDNWVNDIGFDLEALKDGAFVLNVTKPIK